MATESKIPEDESASACAEEPVTDPYKSSEVIAESTEKRMVDSQEDADLECIKQPARTSENMGPIKEASIPNVNLSTKSCAKDETRDPTISVEESGLDSQTKSRQEDQLGEQGTLILEETEVAASRENAIKRVEQNILSVEEFKEKGEKDEQTFTADSGETSIALEKIPPLAEPITKIKDEENKILQKIANDLNPTDPLVGETEKPESTDISEDSAIKLETIHEEKRDSQPNNGQEDHLGEQVTLIPEEVEVADSTENAENRVEQNTLLVEEFEEKGEKDEPTSTPDSGETSILTEKIPTQDEPITKIQGEENVIPHKIANDLNPTPLVGEKEQPDSTDMSEDSTIKSENIHEERRDSQSNNGQEDHLGEQETLIQEYTEIAASRENAEKSVEQNTLLVEEVEEKGEMDDPTSTLDSGETSILTEKIPPLAESITKIKGEEHQESNKFCSENNEQEDHLSETQSTENLVVKHGDSEATVTLETITQLTKDIEKPQKVPDSHSKDEIGIKGDEKIISEEEAINKKLNAAESVNEDEDPSTLATVESARDETIEQSSHEESLKDGEITMIEKNESQGPKHEAEVLDSGVIEEDHHNIEDDGADISKLASIEELNPKVHEKLLDQRLELITDQHASFEVIPTVIEKEMIASQTNENTTPKRDEDADLESNQQAIGISNKSCINDEDTNNSMHVDDKSKEIISSELQNEQAGHVQEVDLNDPDSTRSCDKSEHENNEEIKLMTSSNEDASTVIEVSSSGAPSNNEDNDKEKLENTSSNLVEDGENTQVDDTPEAEDLACINRDIREEHEEKIVQTGPPENSEESEINPETHHEEKREIEALREISVSTEKSLSSVESKSEISNEERISPQQIVNNLKTTDPDSGDIVSKTDAPEEHQESSELCVEDNKQHDHHPETQSTEDLIIKQVDPIVKTETASESVKDIEEINKFPSSYSEEKIDEDEKIIPEEFKVVEEAVDEQSHEAAKEGISEDQAPLLTTTLIRDEAIEQSTMEESSEFQGERILESEQFQADKAEAINETSIEEPEEHENEKSSMLASAQNSNLKVHDEETTSDNSCLDQNLKVLTDQHASSEVIPESVEKEMTIFQTNEITNSKREEDADLECNEQIISTNEITLGKITEASLPDLELATNSKSEEDESVIESLTKDEGIETTKHVEEKRDSLQKNDQEFELGEQAVLIPEKIKEESPGEKDEKNIEQSTHTEEKSEEQEKDEPTSSPDSGEKLISTEKSLPVAEYANKINSEEKILSQNIASGLNTEDPLVEDSGKFDIDEIGKETQTEAQEKIEDSRKVCNENDKQDVVFTAEVLGSEVVTLNSFQENEKQIQNSSDEPHEEIKGESHVFDCPREIIQNDPNECSSAESKSSADSSSFDKSPTENTCDSEHEIPTKSEKEKQHQNEVEATEDKVIEEHHDNIEGSGAETSKVASIEEPNPKVHEEETSIDNKHLDEQATSEVIPAITEKEMIASQTNEKKPPKRDEDADLESNHQATSIFENSCVNNEDINTAIRVEDEFKEKISTELQNEQAGQVQEVDLKDPESIRSSDKSEHENNEEIKLMTSNTEVIEVSTSEAPSNNEDNDKEKLENTSSNLVADGENTQVAIEAGETMPDASNATCQDSNQEICESVKHEIDVTPVDDTVEAEDISCLNRDIRGEHEEKIVQPGHPDNSEINPETHDEEKRDLNHKIEQEHEVGEQAHLILENVETKASRETSVSTEKSPSSVESISEISNEERISTQQSVNNDPLFEETGRPDSGDIVSKTDATEEHQESSEFCVEDNKKHDYHPETQSTEDLIIEQVDPIVKTETASESVKDIEEINKFPSSYSEEKIDEDEKIIREEFKVMEEAVDEQSRETAKEGISEDQAPLLTTTSIRDEAIEKSTMEESLKDSESTMIEKNENHEAENDAEEKIKELQKAELEESSESEQFQADKAEAINDTSIEESDHGMEDESEKSSILASAQNSNPNVHDKEDADLESDEQITSTNMITKHVEDEHKAEMAFISEGEQKDPESVGSSNKLEHENDEEEDASTTNVVQIPHAHNVEESISESASKKGDDDENYRENPSSNPLMNEESPQVTIEANEEDSKQAGLPETIEDSIIEMRDVEKRDSLQENDREYELGEQEVLIPEKIEESPGEKAEKRIEQSTHTDEKSEEQENDEPTSSPDSGETLISTEKNLPLADSANKINSEETILSQNIASGLNTEDPLVEDSGKFDIDEIGNETQTEAQEKIEDSSKIRNENDKQDEQHSEASSTENLVINHMDSEEMVMTNTTIESTRETEELDRVQESTSPEKNDHEGDEKIIPDKSKEIEETTGVFENEALTRLPRTASVEEEKIDHSFQEETLDNNESCNESPKDVEAFDLPETNGRQDISEKQVIEESVEETVKSFQDEEIKTQTLREDTSREIEVKSSVSSLPSELIQNGKSDESILCESKETVENSEILDMSSKKEELSREYVSPTPIEASIDNQDECAYSMKVDEETYAQLEKNSQKEKMEEEPKDMDDGKENKASHNEVSELPETEVSASKPEEEIEITAGTSSSTAVGTDTRKVFIEEVECDQTKIKEEVEVTESEAKIEENTAMKEVKPEDVDHLEGSDGARETIDVTSETKSNCYSGDTAERQEAETNSESRSVEVKEVVDQGEQISHEIEEKDSVTGINHEIELTTTDDQSVSAITDSYMVPSYEELKTAENTPAREDVLFVETEASSTTHSEGALDNENGKEHSNEEIQKHSDEDQPMPPNLKAEDITPENSNLNEARELEILDDEKSAIESTKTLLQKEELTKKTEDSSAVTKVEREAAELKTATSGCQEEYLDTESGELLTEKDQSEDILLLSNNIKTEGKDHNNLQDQDSQSVQEVPSSNLEPSCNDEDLLNSSLDQDGSINAIEPTHERSGVADNNESVREHPIEDTLKSPGEETEKEVEVSTSKLTEQNESTNSVEEEKPVTSDNQTEQNVEMTDLNVYEKDTEASSINKDHSPTDDPKIVPVTVEIEETEHERGSVIESKSKGETSITTDKTTSYSIDNSEKEEISEDLNEGDLKMDSCFMETDKTTTVQQEREQSISSISISQDSPAPLVEEKAKMGNAKSTREEITDEAAETYLVHSIENTLPHKEREDVIKPRVKEEKDLVEVSKCTTNNTFEDSEIEQGQYNKYKTLEGNLTNVAESTVTNIGSIEHDEEKSKTYEDGGTEQEIREGRTEEVMVQGEKDQEVEADNSQKEHIDTEEVSKSTREIPKPEEGSLGEVDVKVAALKEDAEGIEQGLHKSDEKPELEVHLGKAKSTSVTGESAGVEEENISSSAREIQKLEESSYVKVDAETRETNEDVEEDKIRKPERDTKAQVQLENAKSTSITVESTRVEEENISSSARQIQKLEESSYVKAEAETRETNEDIEEALRKPDGDTKAQVEIENAKSTNITVESTRVEEATDVTAKAQNATETTKCEEAKAEREEEGIHENETKEPSPSGSAVMVEIPKEEEEKVKHRKSHNILSGVGSKVKHSISRVKKAITGKSSHPKTSSPK